MKKVLQLPHEKHEGTCYINGLYDILTWKGAHYEYFLLPIIGGMAGFSYMRFKRADPQEMVYWGNSPKYLLKELNAVLPYEVIISEGKAWKTTYAKIIESLDHDEPVVAGALDMYYLHYYTGIYHTTHIPIHYVLIVGYDDEKETFSILDCSYKNLQEVSYEDFIKSMDVKVPGMSNKNTIRMFKLREHLPDEYEVAQKGLRYKAERMLHPPIKMIGMPAMRKLADAITGWDCEKCIQHMVAYAGNTPPLVPENLEHCNGLRFEQAKVLIMLGKKYDEKNWTEAGELFNTSGKLIIEFCRNALQHELEQSKKFILEIADIEEKAYNFFL